MKLVAHVGVIVLFFFSIFIVVPSTVLAAGSVSILPNRIQASLADTVSQDIKISTNEDTVNAVQIVLTYPSEKLSLVSINASGSAFPVGITSNGGNGKIHISRGVLGPGVYGNDQLVASLKFKVAKDSTGEATVTVTKETVLVRSSDQQNIFKDAINGVIVISAAHPTPTIPAASASLSITDVRASGISYNKATIKWSTSKPATSVVEYGLSKSYGFSVEQEQLTYEHSVPLPENVLVPGTLYYFRVKSTDKDQQTTISESTTFTTIGAGVAIHILDSKGDAIAGAKITASTPQSTFVQTTDERGVANFSNMPPTKVDIVTEVQGKKQTSTIAVKEPTHHASLKQQNYIVRVAGMQKRPQTTWLIGIGIFMVIIALLAVVLFLRKRKKTLQNTQVQPIQQQAQAGTNN